MKSVHVQLPSALRFKGCCIVIVIQEVMDRVSVISNMDFGDQVQPQCHLGSTHVMTDDGFHT